MFSEIVAVMQAAEDIFRMARGGEYRNIARRAVQLGLDFVPVEELQTMLTDEAAARAELAADLAEAEKLRGG